MESQVFQDQHFARLERLGRRLDAWADDLVDLVHWLAQQLPKSLGDPIHLEGSVLLGIALGPAKMAHDDHGRPGV